MKVRQTAKTDVGLTRDHNEDCFGLGREELADSKGYLLVVCDGMGGHAAGEVASKLAVDTIINGYYSSDDPDRAAVLEQSFLQANELIYAEGRGSMGTTGVAALLYEDTLHVANVGDSRAYLLRDGKLSQLSHDHSFVAEQVAAGVLTPDQARTSIHRNVITRALGYQPEVSVDMERWLVVPGDLILLSSDGLHSLVEDQEIAELAHQYLPEDLVGRLVALANARGGSDNITVAVARVDTVESGIPTTPLQPEPQLADTPAAPPSPPQQATSNQRRSPTPELPLKLWGVLLAGITALTLLGFALWAVNDPGLTPTLSPTPLLGLPAVTRSPGISATAPTLATATSRQSPSPLLTLTPSRPTSPPTTLTTTP